MTEKSNVISLVDYSGFKSPLVKRYFQKILEFNQALTQAMESGEKKGKLKIPFASDLLSEENSGYVSNIDTAWNWARGTFGPMRIWHHRTCVSEGVKLIEQRLKSDFLAGELNNMEESEKLLLQQRVNTIKERIAEGGDINDSGLFTVDGANLMIAVYTHGQLAMCLDENDLVTVAIDGSPNDQRWHAANILLAMGEVLDAEPEGEIVVSRKIEMAFRVGFLYRDAWWLQKHGKAAASHYDGIRKRTEASGDASKGNRKRRREAMLAHMERLAKASPDAKRFGMEALAGLAIEDAAKAEPALWSQGQGARDEYLGEIRRGEAGGDLKRRYKAITEENPLSPFKN